ncbi:MarR family transcriptional regulator [Bdellovibrio bacteriovorus]|uniref:MarR family winged helix-turn-helix transcriptional regulator n=1 Tax=Bdellovibrio bacteriovorus TaxID=959 RepID=UPI0021D39C43|nr:MarR family transcriptional regulator [Bdellovibrio bacteriovorus]UXR64554.1 MarR family transcriptional regulator [Bdellovibrio bacteriovorus]
MAKLFIQDIPSEEEVQASVLSLNSAVDSAAALYSNLLFMKVASEIENSLDSLLAKYNLSSGRFMLLFMLRNSPAGLRPSELANQVGVTQATISGLINSLEKAELVVREGHQSDGRSFVIKLAPKGEQLIQEIFPQWYPRVVNFWNVISEQEKGSMNGLLAKMIQNKSALTPRG